MAPTHASELGKWIATPTVLCAKINEAPAKMIHRIKCESSRSISDGRLDGSSEQEHEPVHVVIDPDRLDRTGIPEVVFGASKDAAQLIDSMGQLLKMHGSVLATRVDCQHVHALTVAFPSLTYSQTANAARVGALPSTGSRVAIVAAGTSDLRVAEEAAFCSVYLGYDVSRYYDVGVAGIHRLLERLSEIRTSDVVLGIAGMEGTLPGILAGLLTAPVIGVPTSVGYGVGSGGQAALTTMLSSCAPGLAVVNIDNGFGAAALAHKICLLKS